MLESHAAVAVVCCMQLVPVATLYLLHPVRRRYAYCPNLTIIDTPGFILKVAACGPGSACLPWVHPQGSSQQEALLQQQQQRCTFPVVGAALISTSLHAAGTQWGGRQHTR
jgi:hypothetical protein